MPITPQRLLDTRTGPDPLGQGISLFHDWSLEKKMQEFSDKSSKSTIDIVNLQEKLMIARVHFEDGVAELSLEPKDKKDDKADKPKTAAK